MGDARFLDIHVLQTMPFANLNRDDLGAPKEMSFGGTTRMRVSSQCYKRATREKLFSLAPHLDFGRRSRVHGHKLAQELIRQRHWPKPEAHIAALDVISPLQEREKNSEDNDDDAGSGGGKRRKQKQPAETPSPFEQLRSDVLLYLNNDDVTRLARLAESQREIYTKLAAETTGPTVPKVQRAKSDKAKWEKALLAALKESTGAGLALFGRMIAALPEGKIDGSCQVAHAFTTHTVKLEVDYFTAVDDFTTGTEDSGSGHLGTAEYASGVFYRYATVDVDTLADYLGNREEAAELAGLFLRAFALTVPSGKQNSTAPHTLPALVYAALRRDRPVNLAAAFETPVPRDVIRGGYLPASLKTLGEHTAAMAGFLGGEGRGWHAHAAMAPPEQVAAGFSAEEEDVFGERLPLPQLTQQVERVVCGEGR